MSATIKGLTTKEREKFVGLQQGCDPINVGPELIAFAMEEGMNSVLLIQKYHKFLNEADEKFLVEQDGDVFCCHGLDFVNLQESANYAFGETREKAIKNYEAVMREATT